MNNFYTPENRYWQDIQVPCYHTDSSFHLKPASFMDLAQEIAFWAAQTLGFGYDELMVNKTAWVICRMHFKFQNPPKWRDEVTLYTWHKGLGGPFFLRDFEMRAKGDTDLSDKSKSLVVATSSWVVMNMESRSLVKSEGLTEMVPAETQCHDDAIVENCTKIVMPKTVAEEKIGERVIEYSDVDFNQHTNNARYLVWAMDCIDYDTVSSQMVRDVRINFNKETKPGDVVELYRSHIADGSLNRWFIEGRLDGKSCFCTQIDF
jgi:medium-chain acyl-[acyl-carrier-protein] hydrolase